MSRGNFDKMITVFSPEGGLYQVEYAFKAVKASNVTTVAVCGKDAAFVVTQRKVPDKLVKPESLTNMYDIDGKVGICVTGRQPDGKSVISTAREMASEYKADNQDYIPVGLLAKRLAGNAQVYTQSAGYRAMGVALIVAGMDRDDATGAWSPKIYKVDPAGHFVGYFATASGAKDIEAVSHLEKKQKAKAFNTMDDTEAAQTALQVLQQASGSSLKAKDVQMAAVTADKKDFHMVPDADVEAWLTQIAERD